jgi:hypothetical protein
MLAWMKAHKRSWRIAFLVLLVVALSGPWGYDRIHVPLPYTCSAPNVRLDADFCGTPLSFLWLLGMMFPETMSMAGDVLRGTVVQPGRLLTPLAIMLLLMPLVSSWFVVFRNDSRLGRRLHLAALTLAAGMVGFALVAIGFAGGLSAWGRGIWGLWGLWLYVTVVVCMLVSEALLSGRRQQIASLSQAA